MIPSASTAPLPPWLIAPSVTAVLTTLLFSSLSFAGERQYLKKKETFCDVTETVCLYGSLTYRVNSRIVSLNARVQKQTVPGVLHITLTGTNRQDVLRLTEITVTIRGKHSEIVDHKLRPDAPDVSEWHLSSFTFEPEIQ